jgi:hypothetical protein
MRLPRECYQMEQTLAHYFEDLRPPQRLGLALWVYGTVLAQSACQSAVVIALLSIGAFNSVRQHLRQWLYDGPDKANPCHSQLEVKLCFAPLVRWVIALWQADCLALAIDSTLHKDRVCVLVVSVLYRGCAIPVAWCSLPANQKGPWVAPIMELLGAIKPAVPSDMRVLVMSDRGLWSPRLWNQIRSLGWHPLMRLKTNTVFQPQGGCRLPAMRLVAGVGHAWVGAGTAFRATNERRFGTLVVMWDEGQKEPWVLLTDLDPQEVGVSWYGLRMWIELGFRVLKSMGWQWQRTRRTDPQRVARYWLVLAVATLWVMAYGTRAEEAEAKGLEPSQLRTPPAVFNSQSRLISVFRRGQSWMRVQLSRGRLWTRLWLRPEPWPSPSAHLQVSYHSLCLVGST